MTTNKFEFDKVVARFKFKKRDLPTLIANDSRNFFLQGFKKQGWDDGVVKAWKERKDSNSTKPILVKTGKLRRAVSNSIRLANWDIVKLAIGSEVPYAAVHNEGFKGKIQGVNSMRKMNMPQRKFMGKSKTLTDKTKKRISDEMKKIFK